MFAHLFKHFLICPVDRWCRIIGLICTTKKVKCIILPLTFADLNKKHNTHKEQQNSIAKNIRYDVIFGFVLHKTQFMQICVVSKKKTMIRFGVCYSAWDEQTLICHIVKNIFQNKLTIYCSLKWRQGAQRFILIQQFTLTRSWYFILQMILFLFYLFVNIRRRFVSVRLNCYGFLVLKWLKFWAISKQAVIFL